MKKLGLWDRGVANGGPSQKPDRKKWPGSSDSSMASGGLIVTLYILAWSKILFAILNQKL